MVREHIQLEKLFFIVNFISDKLELLCDLEIALVRIERRKSHRNDLLIPQGKVLENLWRITRIK